MESLEKLFASHFKDDNRTITNTLAGFIDHAVRLKANLPTTSPLAPLLKDANLVTQALSLKAQQALQQLGLSRGTQKEATLQTEAARLTAFNRIRKNEATLRGDMFIEDAEERTRLYNLLYPTGGVQYYTAAKLDTQTADRFGEYLARTEAEANALGPRFVQLVQDELGPFRTVRDNQVAALSKTGDAQGAVRNLVEALNEQCDYNWHLLSCHSRTDLAAVARYWKSIFYIRTAPRAAAGELLNLGIKAHQHRQLYDLTGQSTVTSLTLTLRDGGPVCLALVDKATAPLPPDTLTVPTGPTPFVVDLAAIPGTGLHLVAYNDTGRVLHLDAHLS